VTAMQSDEILATRQDHPWVVATPHRVKTGSDENWRPFGKRHAFERGTTRTACGSSMPDSRIFLDVAFNPDHHQACRACAERVSPRRR
jgi:hypothetical protein